MHQLFDASTDLPYRLGVDRYTVFCGVSTDLHSREGIDRCVRLVGVTTAIALPQISALWRYNHRSARFTLTLSIVTVAVRM